MKAQAEAQEAQALAMKAQQEAQLVMPRGLADLQKLVAEAVKIELENMANGAALIPGNPYPQDGQVTF